MHIRLVLISVPALDMVQLWCVLVGRLWFLANSGVFWLVLVSSGLVLVCSGGVPVGSGEFWWVLVASGEF